MYSKNDSFDEFEAYEDQFDPLQTDRQARRKRKPRVNPKQKQSPTQSIQALADIGGLEGGFETTYQPARHEEGWLLESLRTFYDQELISDVMSQIKGGKEASVYRCAAHPALGTEWVAAKVYRPRMFRNLRNDKTYRRGRPILTQNGRAVHKTDHRMIRAIGKKTAFGEQIEHTSWLMYEYTMLQRLYQAGGDVPRPIAASSNAILMGYIGDEHMAAPTLNHINPEPPEATALFYDVMKNVELMLEHGRIHGDLSAYNILYWQGQITLIDFPQVVNSHVSPDTHVQGSQVNPDAYNILKRDIVRICDYFSRQGVVCDAPTIMRQLWQTYVKNRADDDLEAALLLEEES